MVRRKTSMAQVTRMLKVALIGSLFIGLLMIAVQRHMCVIELCTKEGNSAIACMTLSRYYHVKYMFTSCEECLRNTE